MDLALFREALRQFLELRDELELADCWVQVTGGEPLLHPELEEILSASSKLFPTRVLTNGTLIDSRMVKLLRRYCTAVQISFDGTREIHDSWRGAGAYDAAFAGLVALEESGVRRSARVTVGSDNIGSVEELLREIGQHIDGFNVSRVVPVEGCAVELPDAADYRRLIYRLYSEHFTNTKVRLTDPFFGPMMKLDYPDACFAGCSAGISGICITEDGGVLPCRRLPIGVGNVGEDNLLRLYREHPLMLSLRRRNLSGRCGECEDRRNCGGSRCVAFAVAGDALAEDPGCIFQSSEQ